MSSVREAGDDVDPFDELGRRALVTNRRRAEELAILVAELVAVPDGAGPALDRPRDLAMSLSHEIIGSAGTFGYTEVSDLARRLEGMLSTFPAGDPDDLVSVTQQIQSALKDSALPDA